MSDERPLARGRWTRRHGGARLLAPLPGLADDPMKRQGSTEPLYPEFETKDSGARVDYPSGMRRDINDGKPRFDLMWPLGVPYKQQFMTRVAELLARGAEKYGDRNWEKANSAEELARFQESAARHFAQWLAGETDEDHASAVVFNLLAYETVKAKPPSFADAFAEALAIFGDPTA